MTVLAEEKGLNRIRTLKLLANPKISGADDHIEFSTIIEDALWFNGKTICLLGVVSGGSSKGYDCW